MLQGGWDTYLITGLIVGMGQFIYAALGFGAALFSISVLSLIYGDVSLFVPFFLLLCLPVEISVTFSERSHIHYARVWPVLLIALPFILTGSFFLAQSSDSHLLFLMGGIVTLTAVTIWLNPEWSIKPEYRSISSWVAGGISGLVGSIFGMSGPPLVLYYKSLGLSRQDFRATLTCVFLTMGLVRAVTYMVLGLYSATSLWLFAFAFPFALGGLYLGNRAHHRFSEDNFKVATSVLLMISGIMLVIEQIL
jgi:uncharacterized membrane protein YfcA